MGTYYNEERKQYENYETAVVARLKSVADAMEMGTDISTILTAATRATEAAEAATAAAADASAAASSAVRYNTAQSLSDAQQAQARGNIGAASEAGFETATGFVPFDGEDGSVTNRNLTVSRVGQRYTVSRTAAHTSNTDLCFMPNLHAANYSSAGANYDNWVTESRVALIPGKRYRMAVRVISGAFPTNERLNLVAMNESGQQIGNGLILALGSRYVDFTFEGTYLTIAGYARAAFATGETPLVFDLAVYDSPEGASIANNEPYIARNNYDIGGLMMWQGQLYKATQAIAAGETIAPGTNVTETTVAAQLAERDTAIAAETAARETAIAGLPMSAGAYFAGLLGANGTVDLNRKRVVVTGNHIHMEGMGSGTSASTYAIFNTLGTLGAVSSSYSAERIKSLFTGGYCYTVKGRPLFATSTGHILRVTYVKRSDVEPQNEWDWGYGLYTYNADTDTVTNLVHNYSMSKENGILIYDTPIASTLIDIARENGNLALVIYGKTDAQWASSKIDLYWEIIPVALTT